MRTSEQINEIAAALAKAQAGYGGARKDATNPHFRSKYATLASIFEAVLPSLNANGLCLVQGTQAPATTGGISVITRLIHTSGQWIETEVNVPVVKPDAQAVGSAITYGRRYGMALVGICAEDDDDGNAAVGPQRASQPQRQQARPPAKQDEQPEPPPAQPSATAACLAFGRRLAAEYAEMGYDSAAEAKAAAKQWFAAKGLTITEVANEGQFDACYESINLTTEGIIE